MTSPVLSVRSLNITTASGREIVTNVSFDLEPGATIAIVGESGSGKTMTARALLGILPAGISASGNAILEGVELIGATERSLQPRRGRDIALMMQNPFTMLHPLKRCGGQVLEGVRATGSQWTQDEAGIETRLREVGIKDGRVAEQFPFQLSGGLLQRVGLAAAIAQGPKVLIADEPTTALDTTTQRAVLRQLGVVQQRHGMALIMITHDLRLAFSMSDRVLVMYAGNALELGPAAALEEDPRHPYTLGLLLAEPDLEHVHARPLAAPGEAPTAAVARVRCPFAERCAWHAPECDVPVTLIHSDASRASACVRIDEIAGELALARADANRAPAVTMERGSSQRPRLIRIDGLGKIFASRTRQTVALEDVSIELFEGESVGLVGESGSGKTTLVRCVMGLETPTAGSIEICGIEASNRPALDESARRALTRSVQMVFQDPYSSLNPAHTVGAALREALRHAGEGSGSAGAEAVSDLLRQVALPAHYAARKPSALSGGERQRVAIARALAVRPRILVLDEAVSALDVTVQAHILELLKELKAEIGLSYLFISHDLAVMRQVADRLYVLRDGHLIESGGIDDVLSSPQTSYARELIHAVPRSDPSWLDVGEPNADAAAPIAG